MKIQKANIQSLWLGFILVPIIPFFYSAWNFRFKRYRIFILLFAMLAGYSFLPTIGSDGESYQSVFKEYVFYSLNDYFALLGDYLAPQSNIIDIYSTSLMFFISRFTSNPAVFFMLAALIYYIFFIKLIDLIISLSQSYINKYSRYFLLGCVFIITFTLGINGIRWALAFVVFSYGSLLFIKTGKLIAVFYAALSILIHFSLLYSFFFLILFVIFNRVQNTPLLYFLLFISIVFSTLLSGYINSKMGLGGEAIQTRYSGYTNESFVQSRNASLNAMNWYGFFDRFGTYYFAIAAIFLTKLPFFRVRTNNLSNSLFAFSVFMLIQSLISGGLVDQFSNRYYLLVNFFTLIYLYYLSAINAFSKPIKNLSNIFLPILIIHIIWNIRIDLSSISPFLIFGNAILVFFVDVEKSLGVLIFGK
jgi:hypothetical protein